jgi:NADPH:quinone reductase-like Zn-dependent oxidoreductase
VKAQLSKRRRGPAVLIPTANPRRASLEDLADEVARGVIQPVIEETFSLDDAATALRHLESEHARAKIVVSRSVHASSPGE